MPTVREVIDRLNEFQAVSDLEAFFLNEGVSAPQDAGCEMCLVAKYVRRETGSTSVKVGYFNTFPDGDFTRLEGKVSHSPVLEQFIESFDMGGLNYRLYEKEKKDGTAA